MKNIILLSIIALGLFAAPQKAQAGSFVNCELKNVPPNFSKKKFSALLIKSGITKKMSTKAIVKSLYKKNGKFYFKLTKAQLNKINTYNKGSLKFTVGVAKEGGGSDI